VVNSSQGGGSKDTWVLAGPTAPEPPAPVAPEVAGMARQPFGTRATGTPVTVTQQQQQQQQQQAVMNHARPQR